jgi:hypothetical protein
MRFKLLITQWPIFGALTGCLLAPWTALAAVSTSDDRITVSGDGASLTGTGGGGGASVGWLHNFDADTLAGVGVEHQVLANAHWTFGSLNGSWSTGAGNQRYSFYGEAHEGAGDDGPKPFKYAIEAVGVYGTFFHRLSLQFEDKQVDVEKTHGNLPKVGVAYLVNPHLQASASYSYSTGGNLGTRLTALRLDCYLPEFNLLAGYSFGQAAPAVILNFQADAAALFFAGPQLHEGYVGVSKPFPHQRSELTLVADYQDLSGIKHAIVTLSYTVHVGHAGTPR